MTCYGDARTMSRAACICLGALLMLGCSGDGQVTAPPGGSFQARLSGARTATLSGPSNAGAFFDEASPEAPFAIRMYAEQGDTVRRILIDCPRLTPPAPGTLRVSGAPGECQARYSRLVFTQGADIIVLEQALASSGSATITASDPGQLSGVFSFTGRLVVGADSLGTITASGGFNAIIVG